MPRLDTAVPLKINNHCHFEVRTSLLMLVGMGGVQQHNTKYETQAEAEAYYQELLAYINHPDHNVTFNEETQEYVADVPEKELDDFHHRFCILDVEGIFMVSQMERKIR